MEKSELLQKIEELLSFDGNEIEINPAYLEYFTHEELENLLKELRSRHENMVEENREWMKGFVSEKDGDTQSLSGSDESEM